MNAYPFVSVLMPVRNEASFMERSLGAVLRQDYPAERIEILVIDGMSTDGTRAVVRGFQENHPNVRLLDNPARIAPTALNIALAAAKGDLIVRVDGHCEIARDYITCAARYLQADGIDAVGGPLDTVGETETAKAIAIAMSSTFGVGGSAFRTLKGKSIFTDTVAFPAYKRSVVEMAGLFDEELVRNQDDEYNYRLRKLGMNILLASDLNCRYYSRGSIRSVASQYFQYGFWKIRVWQKHPRQMQWRQFVPFLFILSLALLFALALISTFARWAVVLELVLYGISNIVASILAARRGEWRSLPIIPVIFAVLHLSYGFGFLIGLINFRHRWHAAENGPGSRPIRTTRESFE
jgi:glycosyltransferase involved in cell wall biosynthesis